MSDDLRPEREVDCPHCKGSGKVTVPPDAAVVRAFFFGCWNRSGHSWHVKNDSMSYIEIERSVPKIVNDHIDGGFCPGANWEDYYRKSRPEVEGEATLTHVAGWTVLGWWDRSVDSRSACNSNVVTPGTRSYADMVSICRNQFPHVLSRRDKEIVLVEERTR